MQERNLTSKQKGDACEMLVAGELTLAGIPAHKMPDNWPHYDIVAQPSQGTTTRISVKSRTFKHGAAYVVYNQNDDFEWLAIVLLPGAEQKQRRYFLLPRSVADSHFTKPSKTGDRDCLVHSVAKKFARFENNFELSMDGKPNTTNEEN